MPDDVLSLHCIVVEFKSVDTLAILNLATPNSTENSDVTPLRFNSSSRGARLLLWGLILQKRNR